MSFSDFIKNDNKSIIWGLLQEGGVFNDIPNNMFENVKKLFESSILSMKPEFDIFFDKNGVLRNCIYGDAVIMDIQINKNIVYNKKYEINNISDTGYINSTEIYDTIEKEINENKNYTFKDLINLSIKLYEKGYSSLDIMKYIETCSLEKEKIYEYLITFNKIRKEFSFLHEDSKIKHLFRHHSRNVYHNLSIPELYELSISKEPANPHTLTSKVANSGAMVAYSGERTGRSP